METISVKTSFIKEAHAAACSTWQGKIERELPELFKKPDLKVGKWYWVDRSGNPIFAGESRALINFQDGDCYGFTHGGFYMTEYGNPKKDKYQFTPATDEEVEAALIDEAKKRGFVEGVGIDNQLFYPHKVGKKNVVGDFIYRAYDTSLDVEGCDDRRYTIFRKGVWATIIESPKEMTKEQIEKELGYKIKISI